ncbi:tetratricopeptide repeat protein [Massilia sp. METH4]|uniref:LytR C-terminal domain-containing protein n=1 Tax=Massilia sp. METH4 TaxID=3123041 RepID=UPI0030CD8BA5
MKNTGKLASAACAGMLLLACGGQATKTPVPFASADAYYALGRAEHAARRFAQARQAWEQALRVDPRHADARNGMAVLLAEQGDYGKATALWRALVEEGKALPAAERAFLLGNLGYALYLRGEQEEALALLEQACVLDPRQPVTWEHLAAVLETLGQTERALKMMKQARTLRTHDIGRDYAVVGRSAPAVAPQPQVQAVTPWPAGMPRTEVHRSGGVFEVRRVAAPVASSDQAAVPTAVPDTSIAPAEGQAGMRLEISNGNGMRGMAAAWARRLQGPQWKSVRLTNAKPFNVLVTRIEHGDAADAGIVARSLAERLGVPAPRVVAARMPEDGARAAQLRIVLGWDQRAASAQAEKKSAQGAVARPDAG